MTHHRGGWSLIELTIILVTLATLGAILAPTVDRYVDHAKTIRAEEDTQMLAMAIHMYMHDTANGLFLQEGSLDPDLGASRARYGGSAPNHWCDNRVNLLVGDGDIPDLGPEGDSRWVRRVNFREVDFMEYHLITNRPGNSEARRYRTPTDLDKGPIGYPSDPMFARDESGGFNGRFAWRGPYVSESIDSDPWGNRYMANVGFLDSCGRWLNHQVEYNGFEYDVVVMSAGPDEQIDSRFEMDGLTGGDDDIMANVSTTAP